MVESIRCRTLSCEIGRQSISGPRERHVRRHSRTLRGDIQRCTPSDLQMTTRYLPGEKKSAFCDRAQSAEPPTAQREEPRAWDDFGKRFLEHSAQGCPNIQRGIQGRRAPISSLAPSIPRDRFLPPGKCEARGRNARVKPCAHRRGKRVCGRRGAAQARAARQPGTDADFAMRSASAARMVEMSHRPPTPRPTTVGRGKQPLCFPSPWPSPRARAEGGFKFPSPRHNGERVTKYYASFHRRR